MFYEVRVIIHAVNKIKKEQGRNVNLSTEYPELQIKYLRIFVYSYLFKIICF